MQSNTPSVLVVDDAEAQRYVLRRALEQANFHVLEAANGQQALDAARRQPDLILLDIRLPDMDGFEVCRRLKADPETSNIPVIQTSSFFVHTEDKITGLEGGADDYLVQPIPHDELVAKLKAWMRVRRAESELRRSNQLLREQAQELRAGEMLLRDVIDGSDSIVFLKDLHGRFITANKQLEKLLGVSCDQLRGKTDYDIFPRDRADHYREHDRRVIETRTPIEFEEVVESRDGTRHIFLSHKFPLRDASGKPYGVCGISHDITDRKAAEAALRKSEDRYRSLFENMAEGFFLAAVICDPSGEPVDYRYLDVNPAFERLTGIKRDQAIGKTVREIFPGVEDHWIKSHGRVALTGNPDRISRFAGPLGRIYEAAAYSPRRGQFACVFTDVTERRQAEEQLLASEEKFRAAFQGAGVGMGRVSLTDARWIDANDALCRMVGYTLEEMQATPGPEITHPDDVNLDLVPFRRMAAGEIDSYTVEKRFIHKQGHLVWARLTLSLVRDAQGRPDYEIAVVEDITQRKQAEQALAEKARLLELSYDAVMVRNAQNRIVYWNQGAIETYGYTREEVLGRNPHELLQTQFSEPLDRIIEALHRDGSWTGELIHTRKDGRNITLSSRWSLDRDANGNPAAILEINRDITERKQAEEALIRTEKLAGAGRMAATIAHEINNPLETITNVLYLIGTDEGLSENSRRQLAIAEDELERVSHLTKQTLAFYRDSNRSSNVDVSSVVEKVASVYRPRALVNDIEFELEGRPDCTVWGSAGELIQVVSNLVANALDAVQAGGKVAVRTSPTRTKAGDAVRISVADSGMGIDPEQLPRIFEPFFTTKKDVGTGLGLWITRELVSKHHGHIRVRSRRGSGTVISVFLPCAPAVSATAEPLAMAI